ncbi:MAG: amidohydrolase [Deltaproteobacteria bacterium]|jgi:predicted TIM-barrel fold metal-dependent hydrolase|nr:amidohydrolase [Deltaproteobacteria bacterium]
MADHRPIIISCDGHATGRPQDYVPYVEPAHRGAYEESVRAHEARLAERAKAKKDKPSLFANEGSFGFEKETGDDLDGEWCSSVRTKVLESEGVVAEVLFPNGGIPFSGSTGSSAHELRGAGHRAYDRWQLDFAGDLPGRRAALALLTVHDLDATLAEIRWAREQGMKGVIIPTVPGAGLPPYQDRCYDPLWGECQDLEMPVHIHGGGGTPDYGDYGVVSMLLYATEVTFFAHRNLWVLIWAGVLDRFPRMKLVLTETRADWVPGALTFLDGIHSAPFFRHIQDTAKLKPSEYFERQCYIGAPFMGRHESAMRHEIGVDKLMWGTDYPHIEGTWPGTRKALARCFKGVPIDEARTILTDTPAKLYGFDIDALQPIADRVCPTTEELVGAI